MIKIKREFDNGVTRFVNIYDTDYQTIINEKYPDWEKCSDSVSDVNITKDDTLDIDFINPIGKEIKKVQISRTFKNGVTRYVNLFDDYNGVIETIKNKYPDWEITKTL